MRSFDGHISFAANALTQELNEAASSL